MHGPGSSSAGPRPGSSATKRGGPTWSIRPGCGQGPGRCWATRPRSTGNPIRFLHRSLADFDTLELRGVETIPTPGHAAHHVAFRQQGLLFLGEAAGTFSSLGAGSTGEQYYLRPATPPRFFPEVARASLERLLALDPLPERLLFAHHGDFTGDTRQLLTYARDQLTLWVETVASVLEIQRGLPHSEQPADEAGLMDLLANRLAQVDPCFARGHSLPDGHS